MSGFPIKTMAVFRRDRFGQLRDMLEQRLDTKFYDMSAKILKTAAVEVRFYDRSGIITDPLRTLSSNVSFEATSSFPYTDGIARNRPSYDDNLNILTVTV